MKPLHKLHFGFGTRTAPVPVELNPVWDRRPAWKQTRGSRIVEILSPQFSAGECDALWTQVTEVPVAVQTADCVPILLSAHRGAETIAVAAIHAGWRGVLARLFPATVMEMRKVLGHDIRLEAYMGPAIGACCFEVKDDVLGPFLKTFAHLPADLVSPKPDRVDLHAIVLAEAEGLDVHEVTDRFHCTVCTRDPDGQPAYNSFRRDRALDAANLRQFSGIFLTRE